MIPVTKKVVKVARENGSEKKSSLMKSSLKDSYLLGLNHQI